MRQSMSVKINEISHTVFEVNGKTVHKDGNDNWVAQEELTSTEMRAFKEHLNAIENTNLG